LFDGENLIPTRLQREDQGFYDRCEKWGFQKGGGEGGKKRSRPTPRRKGAVVHQPLQSCMDQRCGKKKKKPNNWKERRPRKKKKGKRKKKKKNRGKKKKGEGHPHMEKANNSSEGKTRSETHEDKRKGGDYSRTVQRKVLLRGEKENSLPSKHSLRGGGGKKKKAVQFGRESWPLIRCQVAP